MEKRLVRQGFLGLDSDKMLAASYVGLVGLGGGGSHFAQQLAHLGVGHFAVLDPDRVDETNLNRLVGATSEDVRRRTPKVDVAERVILGINPDARVVKAKHKWQERGELLRDCTAIFGSLDSFSEREQLEIAARRYLVPYIDIGMDVHAVGSGFCISGQVILSMPGELCMRCLGVITDDTLSREAARYGAVSGRPQVVWPNALLASTAVGLFVQLVTPWHSQPVPTAYLEYEGNLPAMVSSNRLKAVEGRACQHFASIDNLGDPFWSPGRPEPGPLLQRSWIKCLRRAFRVRGRRD